MNRVIAVAFALALAAPAFAQEPEARPGRDREELFKMVDAYLVSNLQESLALTDAQFVKILPFVKKAQTDRRTAAQRRNMTLAEMSRLLESGTATEAAVSDLLQQLKRREVEDTDAQRKNLEALDAHLSIVQQAKLRVLMARVEMKIRDLAGRARQGGPGGRPRRDDFGEPNP